MTHKFLLYSLGCKVNSYECSALRTLMLDKGFVEAKKGEEVDVVIINTCSVTATADQKSRQQIRKFKTKYPNAIICVMGCYSQGNPEYIQNEIGAHVIVGTSNRSLIPVLVMNCLQKPTIFNRTRNNPRNFLYEELGVVAHSENIRAYLKIQDGCDNFCSYCLIPYRRGKSRSREFNNVIKEAENLVNLGYKEIVLTGIHVGGYGSDLKNHNFSELVEAISNIEGLYRLRISSIEESEIDDKLIDLIKTRDNIAKHLHIPLQSGSDTVLKRMNRKYTCEEFKNKLNKIRRLIPEIALTTDVIVGFPGETEEEFNETRQFIIDCDFNMLHVFPFSAREGTAAYFMKGQLDNSIKKARSHKLLELSKELWDKYTDQFISKEISILIEQIDKEKGLCYGHSSNFINISIPFNDEKPGNIVKTTLKKTDVIE